MRELSQDKLLCWRRGRRRVGAAALDYMLVLCVILPLATFMMWIGPRIARLAYEMVCVLISWPFM
jgi:hypothetical protein